MTKAASTSISANPRTTRIRKPVSVPSLSAASWVKGGSDDEVEKTDVSMASPSSPHQSDVKHLLGEDAVQKKTMSSKLEAKERELLRTETELIRMLEDVRIAKVSVSEMRRRLDED
jgi:hypothetical protein